MGLGVVASRDKRFVGVGTYGQAPHDAPAVSHQPLALGPCFRRTCTRAAASAACMRPAEKLSISRVLGDNAPTPNGAGPSASVRGLGTGPLRGAAVAARGSMMERLHSRSGFRPHSRRLQLGRRRLPCRIRAQADPPPRRPTSECDAAAARNQTMPTAARRALVWLQTWLTKPCKSSLKTLVLHALSSASLPDWPMGRRRPRRSRAWWRI